MSLPLPPPDISPKKQNEQEKLERLIGDLRLKHPIPPEAKVPQTPATTAEVEEVKKYLTEVKIPTSSVPLDRIFVGGEILEFSRIQEGRVGYYRDTGVAAFRYHYSDKLLKTVILIPRDGIKARPLAKGIIWRQTNEIPIEVAHSEIVEIEEFFKIKALDEDALTDTPLLDRFKREFEGKTIRQIIGLEQSVKSRTSENESLKNEVQKWRATAAEREQELASKHEEYLGMQHRSEHWKVAALFASSTAIFLASMRFL